MRVATIFVGMMLAVTTLTAEEHQPELAAHLGSRGGGSLDATYGASGAEAGVALTWGLSGSWWIRQDAWLEVLFDRQVLEFESDDAEPRRFDVNVDFLQFGAAYQPQRDGLKPYVTMALGLSRFGSDPGSVDNSTGLSASIAAGFKVPIGKTTLFRLEARGWGAFTDSSAAIACGQGCAFALGSEGWWQLGVRAAIAYCPDGVR